MHSCALPEVKRETPQGAEDTWASKKSQNLEANPLLSFMQVSKINLNSSFFSLPDSKTFFREIFEYLHSIICIQGDLLPFLLSRLFYFWKLDSFSFLFHIHLSSILLHS